MDWYKFLWSKIGGRPWTYIARDFYHRAEYGVLVSLFFFGYIVGVSGLVSWKWLAVLMGIYTLGFIHGHFFWTETYIPEQRVGDSIGLSYLAGLFDGEGSIIIKVKKYGVTLQHTIMCQIGMTNRDAVYQFYNKFGGTIWEEPCPANGNLPSWHWSAQSGICSDALSALYPYLKTKKEEAHIAIDFYANKSTLSLTERERERHYLHSLKHNRRILKDYGIPK